MRCDNDKQYVATFATHLGALEFYETLQALGDKKSKMSPVPRTISISCGTGVYFYREFDPSTMSNPDLEKVFLIQDQDYLELWANPNP